MAQSLHYLGVSWRFLKEEGCFRSKALKKSMKRKKALAAALQGVQVCNDALKGHDNHIHAANCGHKSYVHAGHVCYEHDGHFHYNHNGHVHECAGPFAQQAVPRTNATTTKARPGTVHSMDVARANKKPKK